MKTSPTILAVIRTSMMGKPYVTLLVASIMMTVRLSVILTIPPIRGSRVVSSLCGHMASPTCPSRPCSLCMPAPPTPCHHLPSWGGDRDPLPFTAPRGRRSPPSCDAQVEARTHPAGQPLPSGHICQGPPRSVGTTEEGQGAATPFSNLRRCVAPPEATGPND